MVVAEPQPRLGRQEDQPELSPGWHIVTAPERLTRGARLAQLLEAIPVDVEAPALFSWEGAMTSSPV